MKAEFAPASGDAGIQIICRPSGEDGLLFHQFAKYLANFQEWELSLGGVVYDCDSQRYTSFNFCPRKKEQKPMAKMPTTIEITLSGEVKNVFTDIRETLQGISDRLEAAEKRIAELETVSSKTS